MKTQNLLKSIFGVAFIAVLLSCDSANNPSALIGHWLQESSSTDKTPEDMELFKDGTGVCDGASISWKVEDKRFIIQSSSRGMANNYEVSGNRLTLTTNNVEKVTYLDINKSPQKGSFTDSRDKKKYETIKIADQTWLAENLNYEAEGSKCYDNDPTNCAKYGRLYNWETAMMNVCPSGWHLPSDKEWQTLVDIARGKIARKNFKAKSGWDNYQGKSGNGTDFYGFSALPGGVGGSSGGFHGVSGCGVWWSSSEDYGNNAYARIMCGEDANVDKRSYGNTNFCSVRCVKD